MAYLDHAATTTMLGEALEAFVSTARDVGNASSLHAAGRRARRGVEEARERVAAALGARPSEVIFTGGGTESDNLAVKGIYWARKAAEARLNRIIASAGEHHAVLDAVDWLGRSEGAQVTWLPVDGNGRVDIEALGRELDRHGSEIALITAMWANNEVGTVQPVSQIAAMAAQRDIPFHTDAIQAIGQVPVDFAACGAAALTATGHKLGGPTGVGALLLGRDIACTPLLHGGGQERAATIGALRDDLVARVRAAVPDAVLNGDPVDRLPGNAHFSFPGCEGDALLLLLDAQDIACSTGSACSAGIAQPSHVLVAMGADESRARSTLRFSLGHTSTSADVDQLATALPGVVERARRAGAVKAARGAATLDR